MVPFCFASELVSIIHFLTSEPFGCFELVAAEEVDAGVDGLVVGSEGGGPGSLLSLYCIVALGMVEEKVQDDEDEQNTGFVHKNTIIFIR